MAKEFSQKSFKDRFPFFRHNPDASYLDNAATTQRFAAAVDAVSRFWLEQNSNINRGAYSLSAVATEMFINARASVANFLSAQDSRSIVFVRGTTEAINLLAYSLAQKLKAGDTILLTQMEHHSNIVPWQIVAKLFSLNIVVADVTEQHILDRGNFSALLREHSPKIVSFTHIANSIGTINPIKELIAEAHKYSALVVVDAAQSVAHQQIDVQDLDCDFLAFSGHKVYAPTGIGVLYGKLDLLNSMAPFHGGGDMIQQVSFSGTSYASAPKRFEAGTPAIAEVIGLAKALEELQSFDRHSLETYQLKLSEQLWSELAALDYIELYGPRRSNLADQHSSIVAFNLKGVHPHDLATICDNYNVQIRAGHHCAMPLLQRLKIPACARASISPYNTEQDIEKLLLALKKAKELFL